MALRPGLPLSALHYFGDLQHRVCFGLDALQLAFFLERLHKLPQIRITHVTPPGNSAVEPTKRTH
jgi:hypothetical protein